MNLSGLSQYGVINPGASEADLDILDTKLGERLPEEYRWFLRATNGISLDNGLILYPSDDLVERNETLEVALYAAGYLAIGDDSGGRAVLVPFTGSGVYLVDQGSMDPSDMREIASSFRQWVTEGCPL